MTRRVLIAVAAFAGALLTAAASARADWTWPVRGEVITLYRNGGDPYASGQHRGIDIAAAPGTPVVAAAGGHVRFAGTAGSSGLTVSIRTDDGRYDTSYLHLSAASVRKGDRVTAGQRVGAVGTSGVRSAAQAHLHFGVREAGTKHSYHDPLAFLPPVSPAPERPRAAPGPSPAPVPLSPAPEPVRRPAPVPHSRRPMPAPHGTPGRVPAPRGAPGRAPVPHGSPGHARADRRGPARSHIPGRVHLPGAQHAGEGEPVPRAAVDPTAHPGSSARVSPGPGASADRGPDVAWVLACLGLLAAAALLGLSEDGRKASRTAARSGRRRITTLVSPRLGGR